MAQLMVAPIPITHPDVMRAWAWSRALAACNFVKFKWPGLHGLLGGRAMLGQLYLYQNDGTDFQIPQKRRSVPGNSIASHKFTFKSSLQYKIRVSILDGDLAWIQGPYPAGTSNDIKIFSKILRHFL